MDWKEVAINKSLAARCSSSGNGGDKRPLDVYWTSLIYLPTLTPAGWKLRSHAGSRLRANFSRLIEKCELLPSCLTQFPKYVNSDPCKEQKPCVKWINDNTFLTISDFWSEKHWERARLRQISDVFGLLRKTSDFFRNLRKWPCRLQKS